MSLPIYVTIGDKPRAVLAVFDSLLERQAEHKRQVEAHAQHVKKRRWVSLVLFLVALPCFVLDALIGYVIGYSGFVFVLIGVFLVIASLFTLFMLRGRKRSKKLHDFPPNYQTARTIIHTLRDDAAPKGNFMGHLDLTGSQKPEKLRRTDRNLAGRKIEYYCDEWFQLKAKLYDGNVLRMTIMENSKKRVGYHKLSQSGKQKWKPAKMKYEQQIKVKVSVNPNAYDVVRTDLARPGTKIGEYTVEKVQLDSTSIVFVASTPKNASGANDILGVLRLVYSQLQRRSMA